MKGKIGFIWGRRILGDILLGKDPITQRGGRLLIGDNISGITQDYDADSVTQNYNIGDKLILPRCRVFHYAKAGGTLVPDMGVKNASNQYLGPVRPVAIALAGATQVVVTVAAGDGIAANGAFAADELKGGHIVIFQFGLTQSINREIVGNTVRAAPGGAMTITLDRPIPSTLPANSTCEAMHSEYFNVQNDVVNYHSVVGLAMLPSAINRYVWLQTWGPTWMAAQPAVGESIVDVNNRQVVFRADGSLGTHGFAPAPGHALDPTTVFAQHAGYIMASALGGGQGAPFVFLQIAP